jgi:hypothetical protein
MEAIVADFISPQHLSMKTNEEFNGNNTYQVKHTYITEYYEELINSLMFVIHCQIKEK